MEFALRMFGEQLLGRLLRCGKVAQRILDECQLHERRLGHIAAQSDCLSVGVSAPASIVAIDGGTCASPKCVSAAMGPLG